MTSKYFNEESFAKKLLNKYIILLGRNGKKNLTKGLSLLESKNKKKFYKILIIQFLKSLFDIFGVASIIPLIYLLVESDKFIVFYNNKISSYNLNFLYFDNFQSLLIFIILFLFIFFFIKFCSRFLHLIMR